MKAKISKKGKIILNLDMSFDGELKYMSRATLRLIEAYEDIRGT